MKQSEIDLPLVGMDLHALAQEHFNIAYLRPFQELVVSTIAEASATGAAHPPLCVILPTGSGKSLCYMLPALFVEGLIIIVYPLRALLRDQYQRFAHANIPAIALHGGQSTQDRHAAFAALRAGTKVVLTNAETLLQGRVLTHLATFTISLLVVDEAHTISRWGRGFRPSLASLGSIASHLSATQTLLFTATADSEVLSDLSAIFAQNRPLSIIRGNSDRANITYHCCPTLSIRRAISTHTADERSRPTLVFCRTRKETEQLAEHYRRSNPGIECTHYHAGRAMSERVAVQSWYTSSTTGVLFATNAFGMGVDKPDIRTVIHTHSSGDPLSYLQESGRGGRDGENCHALLIYKGLSQSPLGQLICAAKGCIRSALLHALGEELEHCNGCDWCNQSVQQKREGEAAILAAVRARPLRYTATSLGTLLAQKRQFDRHSGHLYTWQTAEIYEAIATLLKENLLQESRLGDRLFTPFR